jgi:hypothetical protein
MKNNTTMRKTLSVMMLLVMVLAVFGAGNTPAAQAQKPWTETPTRGATKMPVTRQLPTVAPTLTAQPDKFNVDEIMMAL